MPRVLPHSLPSYFSASSASHPILSSERAADWEAGILRAESDAWKAMQRVGIQLAKGTLAEFELGSRKAKALRILGLIGKGHNGGDALLAIERIVLDGKASRVCLLVSAPLTQLKENTGWALDRLREACVECELHVVEFTEGAAWLAESAKRLQAGCFDITFDGLLGMSFKAPVRSPVRELIEMLNENETLGLRVAVDLPSGLGDIRDSVAFRSDVTFATGIAKEALVAFENEQELGHTRYLDIGFFEENPSSRYRVLTRAILHPLRVRRPSLSEKRLHGHLLILAGSVSMPGALLMCVQTAVSSGVGLVTVFAPESICPQLAVAIPEAMWVPWPEDPDGNLALEGEHLLRRFESKATALVVGPGIGGAAETKALVCSIVSYWKTPILLDADALSSDVVSALQKRPVANVLLTPHLGELFRISGLKSDSLTNEALIDFAEKCGAVLVLKGANARIVTKENVFLNTSGNSVLSRGGSGDVLSGLCGGLLAQFPASISEVACMGVYWHGVAADLLAREKGQVAVRTTQSIDYLQPALSEEES